jgi:hypothetical protein
VTSAPQFENPPFCDTFVDRVRRELQGEEPVPPADHSPNLLHLAPFQVCTVLRIAHYQHHLALHNVCRIVSRASTIGRAWGRCRLQPSCSVVSLRCAMCGHTGFPATETAVSPAGPACLPVLLRCSAPQKTAASSQNLPTISTIATKKPF